MVLLTAIQKIQRKTRQARVLILGLDNAGKSSLVAKILGDPPEEVQPTVGFQIRTYSAQHQNLTLNLWDVGGQQSLRPFWHNYFENTDFLVWVVDASAVDRLDSCREELHNVLGAEETDLQGAGVLIWINKIDDYKGDREDLKSIISSQLQLDSIGEHRVMECSALTGEGVQEGLEYMESEIAQRLYYA